MPTEFVVRKAKTFPKEQDLPKVYVDFVYNNKREIYLTSPRRYKVKVRIFKNIDGQISLKGAKWEKFAKDNFDIKVKFLHFVEEGEDTFYVTGYFNNGTEAIGYADLDIRKRFPRFMTRAKPYKGSLIQTLNEDFMKNKPLHNQEQHVPNHITIKANWISYNVGLRRVRVGRKGFKYRLNDDRWNIIKNELGLDNGLMVVFTKKRADKLWLTAFNEDGSARTIVKFHGAITLRPLQPKLSFWEESDDRLKHRCQWLLHRDHFGEKLDTFYKEYAKIQDKERLSIPSKFQKFHPMHVYSKALMKHNSYEELMTMKMVYHYEDPERTNHVEVHGEWKKFAKKCKFEYKKLIRFTFVNLEHDEDNELGEPEVYPVFHLC